MAVLRSHEFGLRIRLGGQGGRQISTGREDYSGGSAVLPTLSKGLEIELSDFESENEIRKGDYLWQVVEIVIGGLPTVLEVACMNLLVSLGRKLLKGSVSTNLFGPMRHQLDLRNVEVGIELLGNIYQVADIIPPGVHFVPLLGRCPSFSRYSSSTCHFFTSSVLRALALAFTFLPARRSKKTSLKVWKQHMASSM